MASTKTVTGGQGRARLSVIGVGPGDPDLLTLKAVRLIKMADVVAYPRTSGGETRARKTAANLITPLHEEFPFELPMSTDPAPAQAAYDAAAKRIANYLAAARSVALLCEGDPLFYGSAAHLCARLAPKHATDIVPGVTSLTAAAAEARLPLATRNDVLKVLPATLESEVLARELAECNSAAIIKVGRHIRRIREIVAEAGLIDSAYFVSSATCDEQSVVPLRDINVGAAPNVYFSIILIARRAVS
ncbi:MAG: precorrin-2 C(20)-methyltransferase [Hyphomicrobiaceae bacterium]